MCENNSYNEHTHFKEAGRRRRRPPEALGIATHTVDGQDVRTVHQTASHYIERARRGEGPAFPQCITYRYHGHHVGDTAPGVLPAEERAGVGHAEGSDRLLHGQWLMDNRMADRATLDAIQKSS